MGVTIMDKQSSRVVDVRDMLCAQALAVVAKAMELLRAGRALAVRYNAADVKHDLVTWATEHGHPVREIDAATLQLTRRQADTP